MLKILLRDLPGFFDVFSEDRARPCRPLEIVCLGFDGDFLFGLCLDLGLLLFIGVFCLSVSYSGTTLNWGSKGLVCMLQLQQGGHDKKAGAGSIHQCSC